MCVGRASRKTDFISPCKLRRISFPSAPRRMSWCYFEAIDSIQIVTHRGQLIETVVRCWIHQARKHGLGCPIATTAREERHLSIILKRNREATTSQLSRYLYSATGTSVSIVTVSKRLHERGLFARRPAVCVPLTSTNRRVRLAWCRQHRDWSMDQRVTVLFTDESRFSQNTDSCRTFIQRKPGTCYHQENIIERHHFVGTVLLVCGEEEIFWVPEVTCMFKLEPW
ncbi:transposable element Tc1 transposase [Trichonephila clavipes]|uniref:Transposable element Tc1 transposase n=1 Tax=Trichonephila clavipes TaxID=2585209 RepID=A0A8X7B880_TRICX|nr:transposable element Tc1 transposase [Trichonephila clavipes]